MNVLILTPDAVGSTLLQRMLTIYMQFHEFDRPVINLHELTNGLAKYYSPEFNRELVGKRAVKNWGYYQQLNEIVDLLDSVDHYKTSRLAHYHIERRGDSLKEQIPFYDYLNKNFYIIACRRSNIFEHALSLSLTSITKKLNVYTAYEKIDTFFDLYKNGIDIDIDVFIDKLDAYKKYIKWSEQYFDVSKYFIYEQDMINIEKFILNLPVFTNQSQLITWDKNFGINFNEYNQIHYSISDIGHLNFEESTRDLLKTSTFFEDQVTLTQYQTLAPLDWPAVHSITDLKNLPADIKNQCKFLLCNGVVPFLEKNYQTAVRKYLPNYQLAQATINQMVDLGIIISGPPIKKQTLEEKKKIIKNFDQCLEKFNSWIMCNPELGNKLDTNDLEDQNKKEQIFWQSITRQIEIKSDSPTAPQLKYQNDDNL